MAKDRVCGMDVDSQTARHTSEYGGQTYVFCSPGCKRSFDANPQQFVQSNGERTP
jgi:YHS domain-containing protein